jgi:hypothetical protein
MSESTTIDFETFMKQNQNTGFDAKKYVEEQRKKIQEEAKEQAEQKVKESKDENTTQVDPDNQLKSAVKSTENQIEYIGFSVPSKIEVKKSAIHGNGIFAKEEILQGELVEELRLFRLGWRMAYQKDPVLERYAIADSSCKCRDCSIHGPSVYIPLGYGALYNYGFDSNIRAEFDFPNLRMSIIATEDIPVGKELLYDDSAFSGKITLSETLK